MKALEKVFDILGEIIAVVLVITFALLIIDANFKFLPDVLYNILNVIRNSGALVLIAVVGLEAISKRNIIFKILFLAMLALIVIFLFFPGTYENLINLVK